jgi:hypothetical protein
MSNEYDAAVTASLQPDTAQAARVGFAAATDTNPDAYAEAKRVARRTGVPVDTVFAMPVEIKRQDAVGSIDFDALAKTSPSTAALLSDVEKAKVAHDDVDNLSKIESALYAIGKWEVGTAKAVASSAMKFNEGAWGVARAGAELLPDFVGAPLANKFAEYGRGQRAMAAGLMPKGAGLLESSWYSGMQSLGLNLMQLPLGLGGKMAPVLTSMGLTTGGQAYGEARDKGISVPQSLAFGTSQGVIEAGTEMIGMPALFGMLKPGQFGAKALEYLIKEQGGEQIATHLQDLNEWAVLNPEKSFNDYLEARPAAAVQTALATAFGGGGQVAIMKGVELYVNRGREAQQASQMGELLTGLNKMAEASKLTQRDTETAQGFFQSVLEDGHDAIYITPEALAQSGLAEQMAQSIPAVAEQLGTAAETGHDIRIPIADLLATMAGPELEQSLLPHVAIEPGGFTQTTAQEYLQSDHAKELQAEVDRVLGEQSDDQTFKDSAQVVKTTIKEQLATAGRFTESVNDAYSAMVGNFYAVQAARMGTTPEEMFKRYPLRIGAESIAGQQFDQGRTLQQLRDDLQKQQAGFDAYDAEIRGGVDPDGDKYFGLADKVTEAMDAFVADLEQIPDDSFSLQAKTKDGRLLLVNPSAQKPGHYQLTRFGSDGKPWGDTQYPTKKQAIKDFLDESDASTVKDFGGQLNQSARLNTDTPEFRKWFGDSKVVDAQGAPLVVYHGTGATDISEFKVSTSGTYGGGIYLTPEIRGANDYAIYRGAPSSTVYPVYAAIKNPASGSEAAQVASWKGEENAREELIKRGYDGVVDMRSGEIVAFYPEQIKSAIGNRGTFDPNDPNILNQQARGSFNPATLQLTLLKNADLSTALHEFGHFFLEVQADLAGQLMQEAAIHGADTLKPGEQQVVKDMQATLDWFGIKDLSEWNALDFEEKRSYHEKFARGFESYLFEGKAPSIELQGLFQRFRAWMMNVYRDLKALNVELTDEVRGVFDRMLATTEQITLAEQGRSMMPLFTSPEQAGMTPEEFAAYQALGVDATAEAIEDLQARGLRDMRWLHNARGRLIQQLQKEAKAQRAEVQIEVRREVMSQPIYRAWQFLTGKAGEKTEAQVEHDKALTEWKTERADFEQKTHDDLKAKILEASPDAKGIERGQLLAKNKRQIDIDTQQAMLEWDKANQKPQTPAAPAAGETAGGFEFGRFDLVELKAIGLPVEVINAVKARRMTAKHGLHPDIVAEMFGFTSGDELVRKLAEVETPSAEIEALTDVRMLEQFGDLASPEAIEKAADKTIHNDARARFVATEANALAKATGQRKVLASAAKEFARAMIARLKVRNIKPGQYASAEVRAAKAAEQASKSGDLATAAAEKRNQLIQNYATRAAYDAQEEVDKGLRYLKKFEGDIKTLDADYADQIGNLLERFDLRKGQSNKAVDKRTALAEWIKAQREAGLEPDIPPELENEAFRTSYKNLTVEEFRGLVDTVRQIEHLGRLKHKLLTAADQRAYEAVRDEITASIEQHAQDREADTRTPTTNMGRAVQGLKRFWAAHIKAATWARVMDGGKDGGPMWEYFVRSANERGDQETTMRAEATGKLSQILAPIFALGKMGGKGIYFPQIGRSLNREARLAIALNVGNASNLQRLQGGEGWTDAQLAPILKTLTAQEWATVQAVWDHFESYRPQIAAKERRIYGKEPEWVAPTSFTVTTADGQTVQMRGGYYPIKYDPAASQRAEEHADAEGAKRQLQGAYTTATTRRSFTKSRVEEVNGRPLLYTLSGLYSGVNDVIHDLAWHEWLVDANRLLRSKTIDGAIRNHYGPEAKQQFKTWVQDIAEGEKGADAAVDMALSRLRQGVSAAGLGFNVMSALIQPLGITQSIVRVGPEYVARGLVKYLSSPLDSTRSVVAASSFMENRARTRFRELNELRNQVQDQSAFNEFIGRYAYFLMMRCQQMVDVPTWLGAYEKAIGEGNDEALAINLADQAVIDAQGGGQTKDLSAIERGGPAQKLFTVFYSFMNTALNLGVGQTMAADTPARKARLAADYALLYVVPAILGYFLKAALTPGDSGDDDMEKIAKKLIANQIDYLMGMMVVVREFQGAAKTAAGVEDFGRAYSGPAGARVVSDAYALSIQAHQGEFDDAFRKAAVNAVGGLFGLPSAQINRSITGVEALHEGKTGNPAAVVFGFQEKR